MYRHDDALLFSGFIASLAAVFFIFLKVLALVVFSWASCSMVGNAPKQKMKCVCGKRLKHRLLWTNLTALFFVLVFFFESLLHILELAIGSVARPPALEEWHFMGFFTKRYGPALKRPFVIFFSVSFISCEYSRLKGWHKLF